MKERQVVMKEHQMLQTVAVKEVVMRPGTVWGPALRRRQAEAVMRGAE